MRRHPFDPLSAVLGVLTVIGGVGVATGSLSPTQIPRAWVGIALAGGLGVLLLVVAVQRLAEERRSESGPFT